MHQRDWVKMVFTYNSFKLESASSVDIEHRYYVGKIKWVNNHPISLWLKPTCTCIF